MKKLFVLMLFMGLSKQAFAWVNPQAVVAPPAVITSSVSVSANGSVTVTVSTPTGSGAYSSGLFNYVTNVHIEMYATGTLTGGATPVKCTTTNLGSLQFLFPTAAATGTSTVVDVKFANPIQGTQASNVTVVCPATASVLWNIEVASFGAP